MSTWFRRMLRVVMPSAAKRGPATATRTTIVWRMDDAAPVGRSAWADTDVDVDSAHADTRPMATESGWLMSSMDLVTGVEVVESDDEDPEMPPDEPGAARATLPWRGAPPFVLAA